MCSVFFYVTAINAPEDGRKSWMPLWKVYNLDNVTFYLEI